MNVCLTYRYSFGRCAMDITFLLIHTAERAVVFFALQDMSKNILIIITVTRSAVPAKRYDKRRTTCSEIIISILDHHHITRMTYDTFALAGELCKSLIYMKTISMTSWKNPKPCKSIFRNFWDCVLSREIVSLLCRLSTEFCLQSQKLIFDEGGERRKLYFFLTLWLARLQ